MDANTKLNQALEMMDKGFKTKADQKRALELVSRHTEIVAKSIRDSLLNKRDVTGIDMTDAETEAYYNAPSQANHVTPKKMEMIKRAGISPELYAGVAEAYEAIKQTPIVSAEKPIEKAQRENIKNFFDVSSEEELAIFFAAMKKKFNITFQWHYVHLWNTTGTVFRRVFWYKNYSVTALQTIQNDVAVFTDRWVRRNELLSIVADESVDCLEKISLAEELETINEYICLRDRKQHNQVKENALNNDME